MVSDTPAGDGKIDNLFYSVSRSENIVDKASMFLPFICLLLDVYSHSKRLKPTIYTIDHKMSFNHFFRRITKILCAIPLGASILYFYRTFNTIQTEAKTAKNYVLLVYQSPFECHHGLKIVAFCHKYAADTSGIFNIEGGKLQKK